MEARLKYNTRDKMLSTIQELLKLQNGAERSIEEERTIAAATNKCIEQGGNEHCRAYVLLQTRDHFYTRFHPRSWLQKREDLQAYAYRQSSLHSFEAISAIYPRHEASVESYFEHLSLGTDLGYGAELGEMWYVLLGDSGGFYYVPLNAVVAVVRISF